MSDTPDFNIKNYDLLKNLKLDLLLKKTPNHIECFDVSTLMGTNTVSSCVVFKNGKPLKSDYRFFNHDSTTKEEGRRNP